MDLHDDATRPPELFRLMYMSRNQVEGGRMGTEAAIVQILHSSRSNNASLGVTGCLIVSADVFLQTLEGKKAAVQFIYDRIERDPRHSDLCVLEAIPTTERRYANWSMAFSGYVDDERASLEMALAISRRPDAGMALAELSNELMRASLRSVPANFRPV